MDENMQISKCHNIRGNTKILNRFFLYKNRGQNIFYLFFKEVFNHFIFIPSFSIRVYLVLAESKIEKQFSSQIDLHCGFLTRCR